MFAAQALVVVTTQILVSYFLYARDRFKVPVFTRTVQLYPSI